MPALYDEATLTIVLGQTKHSSADVATVVEDIQALVACAVWPTLFNDEEQWEIARSLLVRENIPEYRDARSFCKVVEQATPGRQIHVAGIIGVDSFLRRQLAIRSGGASSRLFSFANIRRLEHNSPLLIELCVVLGAAATLPALLAMALMRAAASAKRANAEAEVREWQVKQLRQDVRHREIQNDILAEYRDAIRVRRKTDPEFVANDPVAAELAKCASPVISDMASNPLIEKVTFGASFGGKTPPS